MALPQATPPVTAFASIKVEEPPCNPFDSLPIETIQQIAEHIDADIVLCRFQASCRAARDAVDGDNFSLWRRRFLATFDPTGWGQKDNIKYKQAYHRRRKVLRNGAKFVNGRSTRSEMACLEVLRELVVDAFGQPSAHPNTFLSENASKSNNIERLVLFLRSEDLLKTIFKPSAHCRRGHTIPNQFDAPLLKTIRVICAPLMLSLDHFLMNEQFGFPDSQQAVYSTSIQQPFFGGNHGLDINMNLVLHHINFWRYHMVRKAENTLFHCFSQLSEGERPQWWREQLKQGGQPLGKYWKSTYAYLDPSELDARRGNEPYSWDDEPIQDIFAAEDDACSFSDLESQPISAADLTWFPTWERHLNARKSTAPTSPTPGVRTRSQKQSGAAGTPEEVANFTSIPFHFDDFDSTSETSYHAEGWLHPLPAQQGIPGWQRFTMMKWSRFDKNEVGAGINGFNVNWDDLWAYEGVVLPGGRIIVGKWWSVSGVDPEVGPGEEEYSGPFVMWCVDGAEGYKVVDEEKIQI